MASLTLQIEINDQPLEGHQHNKLVRDFGEEHSAILGRITRANQDAAGPRAEPVEVVLKAICEAVVAAEATVIDVES